MTDRFGVSFTKLDVKKTGPGSKFMQSFERMKRDFPMGFDKEKGIGPLKFDSSNAGHYDEDDGTVILPLYIAPGSVHFICFRANRTRADMLSLFDPVISQVIGLVENQIKEAKSKGQTIEVSTFAMWHLPSMRADFPAYYFSRRLW